LDPLDTPVLGPFASSSPVAEPNGDSERERERERDTYRERERESREIQRE
jgi:hypothetical protein